MKKILLLLLLLVSINSFAQEFRVRYYDSATIWPRLRFLTLLNGTPTDSLVAHKINGQVTRLHANQLPINFSQLLNKPTALSGYGITDAATSTDLTNGLATKENIIASGTTGQYWRGDKTWQALNSSVVGLSNVNNTSDANKPISTATQTALNAKFDIPTGTTLQYIRGDGSLSTLPTIPVTSVFGRTGAVTAQSGDYNTSQVTESSNLYYTQTRFDNAFSGKTTTNLAEGTNLYFNNSRARAALSAGNNITYDNSSGVISLTQPTVSTTSRTLNSNFTISSTKFAQVSYVISLSVTNPLLVGSSTASVFLEYSTNGGSSWNLVSQASNSSQVGITVTIAITNIQTSVVSGIIPANSLVRLRSTTSGTASVTFVSSQEVVY